MKNLIRLIYHKKNNPSTKIHFSSRVSLDCKFGKNVKIFEGTRLGTCNIGSYSYIGSHCDFARTTIGPFSSVGTEVLCGIGTHPLNYVSTYPGFFSSHASGAKWFGVNTEFIEQENKFVVMGADVWIGSRAIILGGVNIGTGAVIAAGAIVTKDIPPYAIAAGVPAKIVRYRFDQAIIERLLESKWWELPEQELYNSAKYFTDPEKLLDYLNHNRT